ncbi:MAG: hypothetical protein EXR67_02705 [Dehalococcoidia bacterium]|nr:hypothetical protein [Dehalococcoidia bacterium]
MAQSLKVSAVLPAAAERIYKAWLSGKEHSAFTGSDAKVTARVGGAFTAWDGYIKGKTLELEPNRRIVQSWRTTDFYDDSSDSRLEVLLEPTARGTKITLVQTNIPYGQADEYRQGWKDHYFAPMKAYFVAGTKKK